MKDSTQTGIKDGYYIPEPSELRIGAKCIVKRFGAWQNIVISDFPILKMVIRNYNSNDVQFPLLSVEYLLATGWITSSTNDSFEKNNFSLKLGEKLEVFYKGSRVFSGKCKGENTFDSVSKMLKI